MLFLLLTILLNVALTALFKVFAYYRIDTLQAIVVNYFTCVVTGSIVLGHFPLGASSFNAPWIGWAAILGIGFIGIFNLLSYCTQKFGITAATVPNKLSLIIPVLAAMLLYGDAMPLTKIAGIAISFPAVYYTTRSTDANSSSEKGIKWLVLLFFGSGLLDTGVTYITRHYFSGSNSAANGDGQSAFLIHQFAIAGIAGSVLILVKAAQKKALLSIRNVIAGIALGIPNYFSLYFLLKLLSSGIMHPSVAIPVNNIGIVCLSAICGLLLFREQITRQKTTGLILSILAIILISWADLYAAGA